MKHKLALQRRLTKTLIATVSTFCAIGLSLIFPEARAQEPNRQLVQAGSASTNNAKRIALVIGNGNYTSAPPLRNPPNDARDMAATLKALGFDVASGINVNQRDMKRLRRLGGPVQNRCQLHQKTRLSKAAPGKVTRPAATSTIKSNSFPKVRLSGI